jgi:putative SOS response-associated peptidase YedK
MKGVGKIFGGGDGLPRFNVAPTQMVLVRTNEGKRGGEGGEGELLRWGLIPFWSKDERIGYSLINARAETVVEKPTFRDAMAKRRCLVAADGFYEWRKNAHGTKTPMYIRVDGGEPFAFAGLWETWKNPAGELIRTCSIVTTTANSVMAGIHDRMPVILDEGDYDRWLRTDMVPAKEAAGLLVPFAAERMAAYPVSRRVNNVRNEGADLILPDLGEGGPGGTTGELPAAGRPGKKKKAPEQPGLFG